jgi:hypothetical protein
MVTATANKTPNVPPSTGTKGTPVAATPQQDAKLLKFARENARQIASGLLVRAAQNGEARDWDGMREYQTLASEWTKMAGTGPAIAAPAAPAMTMAATAGK